MDQSIDLGPVEYMVIDFPGNCFTVRIAPAIADLVNRRMVRILDLVFVKKAAELKKLAELRDAGILNEEEFSGRKSLCSVADVMVGGER